MRITRRQLRRIIREAAAGRLHEQEVDTGTILGALDNQEATAMVDAALSEEGIPQFKKAILKLGYNIVDSQFSAADAMVDGGIPDEVDQRILDKVKANWNAKSEKMAEALVPKIRESVIGILRQAVEDLG